MHISYVNMYNALLKLKYLFCRTASEIHLNCHKLQMLSYHKQVTVVAESIRCLGQETEQYDNISVQYNCKKL